MESDRVTISGSLFASALTDFLATVTTLHHREVVMLRDPSVGRTRPALAMDHRKNAAASQLSPNASE